MKAHMEPTQHSRLTTTVAAAASLLDGPTHRLATTLLGEALLEAALLTRLEVEAVLLDVLADALALHLPAETAHGLIKRLVLTDSDEDQGRLR